MSARGLTLARDERGDTLVEILVAILIVGLTGVAILGAFETSIASSAVHRSAANIDTALRSFASAATYQIQLQPSPEFTDCPSAPYHVISPYPSNASQGSKIVVYGTGFANGRSISISIGPTTSTLTNVTSGITSGAQVSNGSVAATLVLPPGLAAGPNLLRVSDGTSGGTGTGSITITTDPAISTNLQGYSIRVDSMSYWNGSTFDATCTPGANEPQLITLAASAPAGAAAPLSFVVTNPGFVSSTWPTFTTSSSTTFAVGQTGSFTIHASGTPTPSYTMSGALPTGVTLTDDHNGYATLAGVPAAGTSGTYMITLAASNGTQPSASQAFTLTVNGPPSFTSASSTTFSVGGAGTFSVTTAGAPTAAITESGALPSGVTFVDNHNGNATLSGTPASGSATSYTFTITASNGVTPNATQTFTLAVDCPPTITSPGSANFAVGLSSSLIVTTSAATFPTAALSESGVLPTGVTFVDNGNGTAKLAGTPASGTAKSYPITITASNGVAPNATQTFTLVVGSAPSFIGGGSSCAGKAKQALTCSLITTNGSPIPTFSLSGSPPAWIALAPNGTGGVTVTGTPPNKTTGTFTFTVVATNAFGTAGLTYVVTVS